jgi:hypothetical protein
MTMDRSKPRWSGRLCGSLPTFHLPVMLGAVAASPAAEVPSVTTFGIEGARGTRACPCVPLACVSRRLPMAVAVVVHACQQHGSRRGARCRRRESWRSASPLRARASRCGVAISPPKGADIGEAPVISDQHHDVGSFASVAGLHMERSCTDTKISAPDRRFEPHAAALTVFIESCRPVEPNGVTSAACGPLLFVCQRFPVQQAEQQGQQHADRQRGHGTGAPA